MSAHFPKQHSPTVQMSHGHPPSRQHSISQSPLPSTAESPVQHRSDSNFYRQTNGATEHPNLQHSYPGEARRLGQSISEEQKPARADNPMSVSSILSSNAADPPNPPHHTLPPTKQFRKSSAARHGDTGPLSTNLKRSYQRNGVTLNDHSSEAPPKLSKTEAHHQNPAKQSKGRSKGAASTSDKENERIQKEIAKIDAMELSDIESPEWMEAKENFVRSSQKRQLEVESIEDGKRKVRQDMRELKNVIELTATTAPPHRYFQEAC